MKIIAFKGKTNASGVGAAGQRWRSMVPLHPPLLSTPAFLKEGGATLQAHPRTASALWKCRSQTLPSLLGWEEVKVSRDLPRPSTAVGQAAWGVWWGGWEAGRGMQAAAPWTVWSLWTHHRHEQCGYLKMEQRTGRAEGEMWPSWRCAVAWGNSCVTHLGTSEPLPPVLTAAGAAAVGPPAFLQTHTCSHDRIFSTSYGILRKLLWLCSRLG